VDPGRPSCDSFDVIDKDILLPEPEVGNIILILSSGAYTISYASEFNGFFHSKDNFNLDGDSP